MSESFCFLSIKKQFLKSVYLSPCSHLKNFLGTEIVGEMLRLTSLFWVNQSIFPWSVYVWSVLGSFSNGNSTDEKEVEKEEVQGTHV